MTFPTDREIVIEMVARLASSPHDHAQQQALRLAARYRDVIQRGAEPLPVPGSELAVEAMGARIP